MKRGFPDNAAANPAIALRLQFTPSAGRVAALGAFVHVRAQRAKMKSRRDDLTVARGKRGTPAAPKLRAKAGAPPRGRGPSVSAPSPPPCPPKLQRRRMEEIDGERRPFALPTT